MILVLTVVESKLYGPDSRDISANDRFLSKKCMNFPNGPFTLLRPYSFIIKRLK